VRRHPWFRGSDRGQKKHTDGTKESNAKKEREKSPRSPLPYNQRKRKPGGSISQQKQQKYGKKP
jgi:hypothetical protein